MLKKVNHVKLRQFCRVSVETVLFEILPPIVFVVIAVGAAGIALCGSPRDMRLMEAATAYWTFGIGVASMVGLMYTANRMAS